MALRQRSISELESIKFIYTQDGVRKELLLKVDGKNDYEREERLSSVKSQIMRFVLNNDSIEYCMTSYEWRDR